jgi:mono/diheme cytochrome c family protein
MTFNHVKSLTVVCLAFVAALSPVSVGAETPTAADNYKTHCAVCHAPDGNSPMPLLNFADGEWKYGTKLRDIVKTITDGRPGTAMMAFKDKMSEAEILALAKYVRAFDKHLK